MTSQTLLQHTVVRVRETNLDLLEYAKLNRDEGIFNDVTLQIDNSSIGANRMVLSCCSTYFETMFKSKLKERYEQNIPIDGVDGKTAITLVDYMYTGEIAINNESVMDILAAADYFQLDEVKTFCFEYLMNRITHYNWYAVQTAARLYRSNQLQKQVNDFIADHFEDIIQSIDFKTFTKNDLISFFSNLNRKQINESSIYQAIVYWIKHKEEERQKEFPDLFQLIELDKLSSDALRDISLETLVQENVTCARSMLSLLSRVMKETKVKENESKIITIGGETNSQAVIEIFNCNCIEQEKYPDLPYDVEGHCSLKLDDVVFCIGGRSSTDSSDVYNKVCQMRLNDANLQWRDVASLNVERCFMGAAVFRDQLVIAGGETENEDWLASTEYFNGLSGEWHMGPPMQQKRSQFCLVDCDDSLFAIGGYDNEEYLSCVERLQSLNKKWEFVASMLTKRTAMACVSLNGYIYAIGGRSNEDESSGHNTVERYDSKLNEWSYICEMNYVRSGACACVLNGRVFVVGGVDDDGDLVKEIECYDSSKDKWEIVQFLWKDGIRNLSALIII